MIIGMDFSSLEETEKAGGKFYKNGKKVDLVECLADYGTNMARLRLWNDPYGKKGEAYMGGTTDYACVERLSKRAKAAGMGLLLDFHYSDFWADPQRQVIPKAWAGLSLDAMCEAIYEFTSRTLDKMSAAKVSPDSVQVGNETTNGMLWPLGKLEEVGKKRNYENLAKMLRSGIAAVKNNSDATITLHLERSFDTPVWVDWLDHVFEQGVDCDIIGASYYPYWHGRMEGLNKNLTSIIERYHKDIVVVETAYPFTNIPKKKTADGTGMCISDPEKLDNGDPVDFPISIEGQRDFINALFETVKALPENRGKGIYWWEPGWLGEEGTSWASEASLKYCHEEGKELGNGWANQCLFDYEGNALPALDVFKKYCENTH